MALNDVVVVDHGDDGSGELAAAMGTVALRNPGNPGFGAGQNRGVAATNSPYVLLVNPDATVDPAGIAAWIGILDERPDVAAVQGVIVNDTTGRPERSSGVALRPVHLLGRALGARRLLGLRVIRRLARRAPGLTDHVERRPAGAIEVESLAATAILVRRSAFDAVEGFDESYFLYGEDLDLCHRLRAGGWRLVALPVEWAHHASGASSSGWWDREVVWWEGTLRYAARWWSRTDWMVAQAAVILRLLPMLAARPSRAPELLALLIRGPRNVRRARCARSVPERGK